MACILRYFSPLCQVGCAMRAPEVIRLLPDCLRLHYAIGLFGMTCEVFTQH